MVFYHAAFFGNLTDGSVDCVLNGFYRGHRHAELLGCLLGSEKHKMA